MLKFQKQQWQRNRSGGLFTEFVARCLGRQPEGRLAAGSLTGSTWDTDCQECPTHTAALLASRTATATKDSPGVQPSVQVALGFVVPCQTWEPGVLSNLWDLSP